MLSSIWMKLILIFFLTNHYF